MQVFYMDGYQQKAEHTRQYRGKPVYGCLLKEVSELAQMCWLFGVTKVCKIKKVSEYDTFKYYKANCLVVQCLCTTNNLKDFACNGSLAGFVIGKLKLVTKFGSIVCRFVHRRHTRAVL